MEKEYIPMSKLATLTGLSYPRLMEYTGNYMLTKYQAKLPMMNKLNKKQICTQYEYTPEALTALKDYLIKRQYKPQTQHAISTLEKEIKSLKGKKVDLGFWDKNGNYKPDIQEVDFEKEGNMW